MVLGCDHNRGTTGLEGISYKRSQGADQEAIIEIELNIVPTWGG